jgi:poly(A) polymerase
LTPAQSTSTTLTPQIIPRDAHVISRQNISDNALKVLYRLNQAGYQAHLVGGCVRDLILGLHPKDFDVVTDATPEQVKRLFNNCRLIGRRFRLAHILFGRDIIEVATFRGHHSGVQDSHQKSQQSTDGQLLRDNVFGTIEEDAQRRDFTINAMYYNVVDFSIQDFANGMQDMVAGSIKLIGDPQQRYREDPVRMLRAVRFSAKLDMTISEETRQPIYEFAELLDNISAARMFEEVNKLLLSGKGLTTYQLLREYGLFERLFPMLSPYLVDITSKASQMIEKVLSNTDQRIAEQQRVTPAFLYAAVLWYPLEAHCQQLMADTQISQYDAFNAAINDILYRQNQRISIPKRFSMVIRDIWQLQLRLPKRFGKRAYMSFVHQKFRAGYDFLLLRGQIEGGELAELVEWWTTFQQQDHLGRKKMVQKYHKTQPRKKRDHVASSDTELIKVSTDSSE